MKIIQKVLVVSSLLCIMVFGNIRATDGQPKVDANSISNITQPIADTWNYAWGIENEAKEKLLSLLGYAKNQVQEGNNIVEKIVPTQIDEKSKSTFIQTKEFIKNHAIIFGSAGFATVLGIVAVVKYYKDGYLFYPQEPSGSDEK